jgi:hypothetical protein
MLLRFSEQYMAEIHFQRFKLFDLCFEFTDNGIHGVMFYDTGLKHVYSMIKTRASDVDNLQHTFYGATDHVVLTWNDDIFKLAEGNVEAMLDPHFHRVQYVHTFTSILLSLIAAYGDRFLLKRSAGLGV